MNVSDSTRAETSLANTQAWLRLSFGVSAWLVTLLICGRVEVHRLLLSIASPVGVFGWFANWNSDTTLVFLVLLCLPFIVANSFWKTSFPAIRRQFQASTRLSVQPQSQLERKWLRHTVTAGLFGVSFLCSASIGWREIPVMQPASDSQMPGQVTFDSLPPAYHDEFSYLLQAQTILNGRMSWPRMTIRPDLFHQIHVLNEPTTASRYFPWTGVWLAPFVAWGHPYLAQWFAGALSCVFFFRSLQMLLPFSWALSGGLLIAVSPGLAVFSNLLLAHHPTMLALSVFLCFFLRLMQSASMFDAVIAGLALCLAMLGRPMTAAGFALPFGLWLLTRVGQSVRRQPHAVTTQYSGRLLLAMGLPLLSGFVVLAVMNHSITGQWTKSAYQYYTDTWTPRHRYGFDNVVVGSRLAGPKVLDAYDRWAINLTPWKAMENVENRLIASSQWTIGIGILVFAIIAALPSCLPFKGADSRLSLLLCSVFSLHLVHVPYWYDGILHWHYVFESAPLLLMLTAVGLRNVSETLRPLRTGVMVRMWLFSLVSASLIPNWVDTDSKSFWGPSRVTQAISEQCFSRVRFEQFRRLTHSTRVQHPCLVIVDESQSDVQLSYIINPPDLTGSVLVCRMPATEMEEMELHRFFPDRTLYKFNPQEFVLTRVTVADHKN